ncbi:MAG TPA: hypothetical protein VFC35_00250 [Gemmatimonadaceae bacterium]|nr:hypothetical protein [Gemmatimonadaceae bacterium]
MPITNFDTLPDSARVWVYGSEPALEGKNADDMLVEVDKFLASWQAHGVPLHSGWNWSDNRFLTIAVDQEQEGASGCSIDGLFRTLKALEARVGGQLITSGLVYYRGKDRQIRAVTRDEFTRLSETGEVDGNTEVFDLSVTWLGEWRARFRSRAADSWHWSLMSSGA